MKKRVLRKSQKVVKGMPSAVVLSIAIHAALFLLAGMLVVFSVVKKEEKKFVPPKAVERPKMKLRKPKVKVKKNSKPKPTTRIVTKVRNANMPDIQLPEMSGMMAGLGGGVGGFDLMPDFSATTLFGARQSIGNDFVGTFYDSKRDRSGKKRFSVDTKGIGWRDTIHKFLVRDWDVTVFSRYYRSPQKLYATNLIVPMTRSSLAPLSFGDEKAVGALWHVHYKGQLVCPATHTNGITIRFWASADEFLAVRVDSELVLAAAWDKEDNRYDYLFREPVFGKLWDSASGDAWKYWLGNTKVEVGDWVSLKPGEALPMEILIGDNGGRCGFFLLVEEEGVEYERNRQGAPILPAFMTSELSPEQLDGIYKSFPEGEMVCLTNGPVFCDYDTSSKAVAPREADPTLSGAAAVEEEPEKTGMRSWVLADGQTMEAEFVILFGGKVVLKNAQGKTCKIPKERLSAEDIEYAELASPPDFDINFLNTFKQQTFSGGWYDAEANWARPPEDWGHYGVQLKQASPGEYNHELRVEMFVIGKQWRRSKYILLDHQETTFNPANEKDRYFEFRSPRKVVIALDEHSETTFGEKHFGYLVTVVDARGEMIAMKSSSKWLPGILENLKELSVGNFMDETGMRTYPDRPPKSTLY